jgi:hypothetical protein
LTPKWPFFGVSGVPGGGVPPPGGGPIWGGPGP